MEMLLAALLLRCFKLVEKALGRLASIENGGAAPKSVAESNL